MLHAGLDLSRKRLDFNLMHPDGQEVEVGAAPPDRDGLRGLAERLARHGEPIRAAIESMNGARFVHDELERFGVEVEIPDAERVKGLAPLACKTDRIDARVLAELSRRDLVPTIWLPDPAVRAERERARFAQVIEGLGVADLLDGDHVGLDSAAHAGELRQLGLVGLLAAGGLIPARAEEVLEVPRCDDHAALLKVPRLPLRPAAAGPNRAGRANPSRSWVLTGQSST